MTHSRIQQSSIARKALSLAGFALVAGLTLQPAPVQAGAVNHRNFQAHGYDFQIDSQSPGEWRKPTGAEILGGFYGADDRIDTRTGEVRYR